MHSTQMYAQTTKTLLSLARQKQVCEKQSSFLFSSSSSFCRRSKSHRRKKPSSSIGNIAAAALNSNTTTMKSRRQTIIRDIVLVGGGHSHVFVLKNFTMHPEPGVRITLVAKDVMTPYSGMLPGNVSGKYTYEECHVDLGKLCREGGHRLIHDECVGIDDKSKRVLLKNQPSVKYDVCSLDVGITPGMLPGAASSSNSPSEASAKSESAKEEALLVTPVKPIGTFATRFETVLRHFKELCDEKRKEDERFRVVVVGGGAGGVELALAMERRFASEVGLTSSSSSSSDAALPYQFALVTRGEVLKGHGKSAREKILAALKARNFEVYENDGVEEVAESSLSLESGKKLGFNECVWCTDAKAQKWLRTNTNLELNEKGFVNIKATLESTNIPDVFAVGDVCNNVEHPRPKAGVYAVRQGPPLAENLRRRCVGENVVPFTPQKTCLALISTGDGHAIASYGSRSWGAHDTAVGERLWRWKDKIDKKWMKMYEPNLEMLEKMEREEQENALNAKANKVAAFAGQEALDAIKATPMRCGGCGAKVGSTILSRVMKRLEPIPTHPNVLLGAGDDAAIVETSPGKVSVQTVDFFRSFIDDPYVFGQIAAVHALGDVWAMNADPVSALATVVVPFGIESEVEETLFQLMSGACDALRDAGCALGGGHSGEGAELSLGFSVTGEVEKDLILRKTSVESGQVLVLTKPIGTGALFAADMRSRAKASDVQKALESMRQPSKRAAEILFLHGATACTDVTGFGILGHLHEMIKDSATSGATIDLSSLPLLDGAVECVQNGITSSLQKSNARLNRAIANIDDVKNFSAYPLLFDPQTAGGMLATIPANEATECIQKLRENGYASSSAIGKIVQCDLSTGVGIGRVFVENAEEGISFDGF